MKLGFFGDFVKLV